MPKTSAGLLLYRERAGSLEVFLVHPGGPYFHGKDLGVWSIPKGEHTPGDDPLTEARREFLEETGFPAPPGDYLDLGETRQASGKLVRAWAVHGDIDAAKVASNHFELEWPPKSGKLQSFPEVDRGGWFTPAEARTRMNPAQAVFVDRLSSALSARASQAMPHSDKS